jgi:hypothetical protein
MDVVLGRLFPRDVVCTILLGFAGHDYYHNTTATGATVIKRVRRLPRSRLTHCAAVLKRWLRYHKRQVVKQYELNWFALTLPPHLNMRFSNFIALPRAKLLMMPVATEMYKMLSGWRHDVYAGARVIGYYRLVVPSYRQHCTLHTHMMVKHGFAVVYNGSRHFQMEWFICMNGIQTMTPSSYLPLRRNRARLPIN